MLKKVLLGLMGLLVVSGKSAKQEQLRFQGLATRRDPLFTKSFRETLGSSEVETVKLPARSPNLNAYAERFVRSVKSECLAQIIPLGERHLRHAVTEYMAHYHVERNHQGINNRLIDDQRGRINMAKGIERRERIGGMLNYYYRRAA